MQKLGVPYPAGYDKVANEDLVKQANEIASDLKKNSVGVKPDKEIIAVIAYLQRLGTDITKNKIIAENQ
jgi:cytochrome c oxidase cbb3-type subunit I/II